MRPEHSSPAKVLRRALKRAGLIDAYDHGCRRCKAKGEEKPHVERHSDDWERRCLKCNMVLWPRAVVRPMRFQDLRHTTATLLLRAGVAAQFVQRILRHRDLRTTMNVYAHLDVNDLRGAVANLPTVSAPERPPTQPVGAPDVAATGTSDQVEAAPRSTRLLPAQECAKEEAGISAQIAPNPASEPLKLERNTGFEPATFALANLRGRVTALRTGSYLSLNHRFSSMWGFGPIDRLFWTWLSSRWNRWREALGGAHGTTLPLAEPVRRTLDRHHPPRTARPHHRPQRGPSPPTPAKLSTLLSRVSDPPCPRQGRA